MSNKNKNIAKKWSGKPDEPGTCEICGYQERSALSGVITECEDGIWRCKHCRHRVLYGKVLHTVEEEIEAVPNYDRLKPIK